MNDHDWEATRQRVLAAIPSGRENAIIADRIHEIAKTPREWRTQIHTRQFIRSLRMEGEPICSSPAVGYWRTTEPREMQACIDSLRHRADEIIALVERMGETYDAMDGDKQKDFFE